MDEETVIRQKIKSIIELCETTKKKTGVPQDIGYYWGDDEFPPNDSSLY